jgi:hypothetical protein
MTVLAVEVIVYVTQAIAKEAPLASLLAICMDLQELILMNAIVPLALNAYQVFANQKHVSQVALQVAMLQVTL